VQATTVLRAKAPQLLSYGVAGVSGTALHYSVAYLLWIQTTLPEVVSTTIGACFGALMNYVLAYYVVFGSSAHHSATLSRFLTVAVTGIGVNALVFRFSLTTTGPIGAQIAATICVFFTGFFLNKHWSFRD
jgi:putative flippase GtrA